MSFTTFLCKIYGDDDAEWLIANRSIDCDSDFHKKFKPLSCLMILVYPIGITAMYSYQLVKFRDALKSAASRDEDQTVQHIAFLWRDYRPELWWFEIYECFRRLSFSGMLVFFEPGSASQLCFSIILALISSLTYAYYKPLEKSEENLLAQISSISIFLTLLAGIMIKLKSALVEANEMEFGFVLILVNTLIFAMRWLAESNDEEAGWMRFDLKDWGGKKKKAKEWLDETRAVADWRSGSGDGPINQARVKFRIEADVESVLSYTTSIKNRHSKSAGSFLYLIDKGKDWRQVYRAVKMLWPLRQRNFVYTEHVRRAGEEVIVCSRSSSELNDTTSAELSMSRGRRGVEMKLSGYLLRPCRGGGTEVIFCVDVDLGGWFAIDYFHRQVAPSYLKGVVDEYRAYSERWRTSRASGDAD
ncbi:hypothetical protein TrLO_g8608 [Triparma laevis f. longispina]|uniref:START domain-containing protein n=1 Tax=Triparma laevis f. longispina TaxID=1714387 RepID=A0A9W7EH92_9STRA|nr:hypothetical protein TrLO_g8608 [Triparma laevis f. longispina]